MSNLKDMWMSQIDISEVGMTLAESLVAEEYIEGQTKMMEWGSGGSTLYFPQLVDYYVSIEHDIKWYDSVKKRISGNVEFHCIEPHEEKFDSELDENAPTILHGSEDWYEKQGSELYVKDNRTHWTTRGVKDWHCYMDYIRYPLNLTHRNYDIILVDGRARAMCAYVSLSLLKDDGHLLFHDFTDRGYYHGILNYFELVNYIDTLAILKKR